MRFIAFASSLVFLAGCSTEKKLVTACDKGEPGACDVLSARYAYGGDGVPKNEAASRQMSERTATLCQTAGAESSATCSRYLVKSVALDSPRAEAGSGEVALVMSVVLGLEGQTQLDGKTIANDDAILPLARNHRERNPELRAVIKADAAVPHGRVIHVLDILKQAGITKIAFGVSPVPPPPPPPLP